MATPGSSFNSTPLGHEVNLRVRYHPRSNTSHPKLTLLLQTSPPPRQENLTSTDITYVNPSTTVASDSSPCNP
ncbi:hypothetical protein TNCV_2978931 [Trichonephila clavipes]|nr:hypothetical protein TNCV_2978931 [Trichonephila clavipes]